MALKWKETQLKFRVPLKSWNTNPEPSASVGAALTLKRQTRKYLVFTFKLRLAARTVTAFKWHTLGSRHARSHTLVGDAALWTTLVFRGRLNALEKSDSIHVVFFSPPHISPEVAGMQWDRQDDKSASASSRTFNLSSGLLVLSAVGQQGGGTQGHYRCHHHLACHLTLAHLSHPHSRRDVETERESTRLHEWKRLGQEAGRKNRRRRVDAAGDQRRCRLRPHHRIRTASSVASKTLTCAFSQAYLEIPVSFVPQTGGGVFGFNAISNKNRASIADTNTDSFEFGRVIRFCQSEIIFMTCFYSCG